MKVPRNVIVFRTVTDEPAYTWVLNEVKHGRLRQGWGPAESQLIQSSIAISREQWAVRAREFSTRAWPQSQYDKTWWTARHRILSGLLELRVGDLVVVPSIPQGPEFTIAIVNRSYQFDLESGYATYPKSLPKDFGHVIGVDQNNLIALDRDMSSDAALIASKFQNYRSAVNIVRQPDYAAAVERLFDVHTVNH